MAAVGTVDDACIAFDEKGWKAGEEDYRRRRGENRGRSPSGDRWIETSLH